MTLPHIFKNMLSEPMHSGVGAIIMMVIILIFAFLLMRSGLGVLRTIARSETGFALILRYIERPGKFVFVLLILQLFISEIPKTASFMVILEDISVLALIGSLTWFGVRFSNALGEIFTRRRIRRKQNDEQYAQRIRTQAKVLVRSLMAIVMVLCIASVLMTFPSVRQIGASLLASAGVAGVIAGMAARPVLANLAAGLQIALTQPIRVGDLVMVKEEVGTIEEIAGSYIVVRLWDQRRLVVPLQWFIENVFQNWTRTNPQMTGTVFLWVDYRMDLDALRAELARLCQIAPEWDGVLQVLQVSDANEKAMQLRILVSTAQATQCWDLRCRIREGLLKFIQEHSPESFPTLRTQVSIPSGSQPANRPDECTPAKDPAAPNMNTQPAIPHSP